MTGLEQILLGVIIWLWVAACLTSVSETEYVNITGLTRGAIFIAWPVLITYMIGKALLNKAGVLPDA